MRIAQDVSRNRRSTATRITIIYFTISNRKERIKFWKVIAIESRWKLLVDKTLNENFIRIGNISKIIYFITEEIL